MKSIRDLKVKGKRVFLRCDFNISQDGHNEAADAFRIERTIPTINYLLKEGAKIVLASHLGDSKLSLSFIQEKLLEYLDVSVTKVEDCVGKEIEDWTKEMENSEILLLENLRFHPEEEANDLGFAEKLSRLADVYINEAFSASHRQHASIVGVPQFLPSAAGPLFLEEVNTLSKAIRDSQKPLVIIIGGAKLNSKIKPISKFLETADSVLLGGKIADTVWRKKKGMAVKEEISPETDKEIRKINLDSYNIKVPLDVCLSESGRIKAIEDMAENDVALDIGPKTRELFKEIINSAKTILWSGPLGKFEDSGFEKGSVEMAKAIKDSSAFSVVGGGDTISFLKKFNLLEGFNYVSTGGGAMLEYLANGTLPGIKALEVCHRF